MKRSLPILIACVTLLLASGCGSSKEGRSASRTASSATESQSSSGPGGEVFGEPGETTSQSARPSGAVVEVAYRDVAISPTKTKAKVGTTIIWTNHDSVEHNVTSVSGPAHFASKNIEEGQGFQFKVTKPGTIRYECTIHPTTMKGTIEVVR